MTQIVNIKHKSTEEGQSTSILNRKTQAIPWWNAMKYKADNCSTVGISFTEVANVRKNPQISWRNKCNYHEETKKPSNLDNTKFARRYRTRTQTPGKSLQEEKYLMRRNITHDFRRRIYQSPTVS